MMLIIMMFLHVATVLAKGNISCSIPAVKPMETTSLTCVFPEDLSQSKKDFSIHIANSTSKPVLDCLWAQGKLECFTSLGFEFNMTVTDKLTMWIPRVFPNMTGEYYCKLADSTGYDIQHCHLVLTKDQEEETNLMAILVPVILTVSVAIVLVLVFLMRRFLTTRQTRIPKGKETEFQEPVLEEELAMISTTEMRDILAPKVENDPLDRCLCAMEVLHKEFLKEDNIIYNTRILLRLFIDPLDDHGYYVKTPAELKFDFFTCMRQWWQSTMSDTDGDMRMTPELYHSMLSRFCGPATQPAAEGQEEPYLLPKTLAEAVSLTGDLYERVMLYQDMTCLQKEERLFLAGPLNTCKTLMLTLAGEKWLSEGHNVYVICDPSVPRDSVMSAFLDQFSHMTNSRNQTIENYAFGSVHEISCNFKTKKERNETVDTLINKRETALCILAYEVGVAGKSFKDLCKRLESQRSDVRLWATAISDKAAPDDWKLFTFQQVLNCPPAVVREASSQELSFADESQAMPYLFPTDGPPVKYITHKIEHCKNCCDCTECGRKVADFLLKHLIIRNEKRGTLEEDRLETSTTIKLKELSLLREKDLLILFEDGKRQRLQFLRGLSEYGITATFIAKEDKKIITAIIDDAWAMNVDLVDSYRPRRKIVVFVESVMGRKDIRTKQKAVKCCNSQLIIVQHNH